MAEGVPSDKLVQTVTQANLMSMRQEEIVRRDIKVLERALHGQPMPYYGGDPIAGQYVPDVGGPHQGTVLVMRDQPVPDREDLEKTLGNCHQTLRQGTAPELSAGARNRLYALYKEEEAKYREGMPSYDQMWRATWQNVQLHSRHAEANKRRGKFLQNARRILDPHDEGFHLEELRPEKPMPYQGLTFRAGYDQVQWSDAKELELRAQELDDETYLQFLTLKAQGIETPRLLQRALHIDQAMYEACMARLKAVDVAVDKRVEAEHSSNARAAKEGKLSAQETHILERYGDATLALLEDQGWQSLERIVDLLIALTPEEFQGSRKMQAHVVARKLCKALVELGHVEEHGTKQDKTYALCFVSDEVQGPVERFMSTPQLVPDEDAEEETLR